MRVVHLHCINRVLRQGQQLSPVQGPIFESISWLDNLGMSIIEEGELRHALP